MKKSARGATYDEETFFEPSPRERTEAIRPPLSPLGKFANRTGQVPRDTATG